MEIDIAQQDFYHENLKELLLWLERTTKLSFKITSQFRFDDNGVHGTNPLRAVDLSLPVSSIGGTVANFINSHCEYDPKRPEFNCAVYHKNKSGNGFHLHLQVHPNTVIS